MISAAKNIVSQVCAKLAKTLSLTQSEIYCEEFPDFDYDYKALIAELGEGWTDVSWKNDSCPSASIWMNKELEHAYRLWFDYKDCNLSEFSERRKLDASAGIMKMYQFSLVDADGTEIFETDKWDEMRSAILKRKIHQEYYDLECENQYIERQRDA